jgi:hypothetical protein
MKEYMVNVDDLKKDNDEKKYELGLANQRITQFEILHNSENKEDRVNDDQHQEIAAVNKQLMAKLKQVKTQRAEDNISHEQNRRLLRSSLTEYQNKCQQLTSDLEVVKQDCKALQTQVDTAYNGDDPDKMTLDLSENIDKLDDIVSRIELNMVDSTSYSDDSNEDLNLTHRMQRDAKNMTMDDLRKRLAELNKRIINLESNCAANACQIQ